MLANATIERLVQIDRVAVRRELRRLDALRLLQRVIRIRRGDGAERFEHARQQHARALERHDRVLERRPAALVGDRRDFGEMRAHALLDRRLVVGVANAVERRRSERQRARREQRILAR